MESVQIDLLVVLIGALLNMAIGAVWYSRWLFGSTLHKECPTHHHHHDGQMSSHANSSCAFSCWKTWVYSFIVSVVITFFLALFEGYLGVTSVTDGMMTGFLVWLGFVATTQIGSVIWCRKPFSVFCINTGYKLFSFLVLGGLIGA